MNEPDTQALAEREDESFEATLAWLKEIGCDHPYTRALAEDVFALDAALREAREALRQAGGFVKLLEQRAILGVKTTTVEYKRAMADLDAASVPAAAPTEEREIPPDDPRGWPEL